MTGSLSHAACPKQVGKSVSPGSFLYNSSWHTNHTSVGQKAYCDLTFGMELDFTGPISENSAVAAVASFTAATYRLSQVIGQPCQESVQHQGTREGTAFLKTRVSSGKFQCFTYHVVY